MSQTQPQMKGETMNDAVKTISELMEKYNESRSQWIKKLGDKFDEKVFHAWFTKQVAG